MTAVLARWQALCRAHPKAIALIDAGSGERLSRAGLDARARAWANRHAPQGLDRRIVLFSMPNGPAWFDLFLGVLHAGGVAMAVDAAEPVAGQVALQASLKAAWRWTDAGLAGPGTGRRFADPDTCLIKLTSGSTGRPRPLVFTSRQMLADAQAIGRTMGLRLKDLNYGLIPFGHSYGLGNLTFPLLGLGIPILTGTSALPHGIAADFTRFHPSVFPGVPALFRGLGQSDLTELPGLRLAISAGAPLAPEVAQAFRARFRVKVHGFYGSSETGGIAYDTTGEETLAGSGTGRPLDGVTVRVLPGQRIRVSGPAVFTLGNPMRIRHQGSWSPADLAERTATGSLRLLGRRDQTVKLAGRRLGLQEVAALLRTIPGVGEVWVGVSDGPEPILGAAVATSLTPPALRAALTPRCPAWKIPKRWATFESLPVTARGKVDLPLIRARLFPA